MQGKIIKGIAGFYYIHVPEKGVYECKAKGIFRNQKLKPLVGDNVLIDVLDENEKLGNLVTILKRNNELIRPAVANIDQAMIIFAAADPEPNFNLLDRFLLMMDRQQVNTIVCFNKTDIVREEKITELREIYKNCGCQVVFTSTYKQEGIDIIREILNGKTTAFAGPSGVGKSSMLNLIKPNANAATGDISEKIKRGKHTTRHSEIMHIEGNTYIMDTPGFSSLYIDDLEKEELKQYFKEFSPYEDGCRFNGCSHIHEPDCSVKKALDAGEISKSRYENYVEMYQELKEKRRW